MTYYKGHVWKVGDVCLLDFGRCQAQGIEPYRVKVTQVIRGGRECFVKYHKQAKPLDIVNSSRLSALPLNHKP